MRNKALRGILVVALAAVALAGQADLRGVEAHHRGERVKLYEGPNPSGELLWTIDEIPFFYADAWWVFAGSPYFDPPIYTVTRDNMYAGSSVYGPIVATFRYNTAYEGAGVFGLALLHLSGGRLFAGNSTRGEILYTIVGHRVFEGSSPRGAILLNATSDIEGFDGPLELVLGLLLGGQLGEPPPPPTPPPPPPPPPWGLAAP